MEATGRFTTSKRVATDFFTRSTRAVSAAANALGARHVLLSIVNCDLPEVQSYGYFAGKCTQERLAQDLSKRMSLVRSTQWFEFAEQNMERMRYGPRLARSLDEDAAGQPRFRRRHGGPGGPE